MFQSTTLTVGEIFDSAVVESLLSIGTRFGLPHIEWTVRHFPEGPLVEGEASEADCRLWAHKLDLVENDNEWNRRSWRSGPSGFGSWELELIAV